MDTLTTLKNLHHYLMQRHGHVDMEIDRTYQGNVHYTFTIYSLKKRFWIYKNFLKGGFENFNVCAPNYHRVYGELTPRLINEAIENLEPNPSIYTKREQFEIDRNNRFKSEEKRVKQQQLNRQKAEFLNQKIKSAENKALTFEHLPKKKMEFIEYYKDKYCYVGMNVEAFKVIMHRIKDEAAKHYG